MGIRGFLSLLLFTCAVQAATVVETSGRVIDVLQGDQLEVRTADGLHHRLLLVGIDAPESNQTFGRQARARLNELALGQEVEIEALARRGDGKILARVTLQGRDLSLLLLREGFAWNDPLQTDFLNGYQQIIYQAAENGARSMKTGLWIDPQPMPPWQWRSR
jgi:micrococcal nuclease